VKCRNFPSQREKNSYFTDFQRVNILLKKHFIPIKTGIYETLLNIIIDKG